MKNEWPHGLKEKNRSIGLTIMVVVVGMVALSYASVPLYNLFCRVTGFGGTTQTAKQAPPESAILDRSVTIMFAANTARGMPWRFRPEMRQEIVKLGKKSLASFRAENPTGQEITGTALYNVSPPKAGKYFHKIQCFCFGEQVLPPGKSVSMPVVFYVDPAMAKDPDMDDVTHITLSYTFFKTGSSDLDKAMEDFYNQPSAKAGE
ncbi:MAG TPA: cytochrome c oxidase assembly protein [Alphaproteobacteria bacterium]|jgi:cytochrome c oxidase assembly protein subunit 11